MNTPNVMRTGDVRPAHDLNAELSEAPIISVPTEVLPPRWAKFSKKNKAKLHVAVLCNNVAETGKLLPASYILAYGVARGDHNGADTAIDSTSGGYALAFAAAIKWQLARDPSFPVRRFIAVVPKSLPKGKRAALEAAGVELIDAGNAVEAMQLAEELAAKHGYWYTRQYWNPDNSRGYEHNARSMAARLPEMGLVAWGVGSGGGCSGTMPVLTEVFADRTLPLRRVAVVVEDGQKIGGVRDEVALEPGSLPWRAPNIDGVRFVGENVSYGFSAALWSTPGGVLLCGPSTGFAAEGAMLAARELVIMRKFDELRAADGFVHMLVPSLDRRDPYLVEFEERFLFFS